tara:strand:+ start:2932 stop:3246 length:315 start_codon:yes stop_codon:yes gene_type:complete
MATKEEKRRENALISSEALRMAANRKKDFEKGELVEATIDYINDDWPHGDKAPKRYGIVLEPKTAMYGDDAPEHATRVQWADNSEETVWQFEIQGVVKSFQEKK